MLRYFAFLFLTMVAGIVAAAGNPVEIRQQFLAAAELRTTDPLAYDVARQALDGYVLAPYLDYARLKHNLSVLDVPAAQHFLDSEKDTQLGNQFRREYLRELARRGEWSRFMDFDVNVHSPGTELRCMRLRALLETGDNKAAREEFESLWATGDSLPDACDPSLAAARGKGWIGSKLVWQRLRLAVDAPNSRLAGYLARQLPASQQEDGARLVKAVADPEATLKSAAGWSDRPLNREAVAVALKRRARRDIDSAMSHWQALESRFAFEPAERAAILHDLALYAAVDYRPAAETWFERVPRDARSEQLVDWQLRAALAVQDWSGVLRITDDLPAPLAAEPRSRYWRARALASLKRESDAEATYASLANEANYYGFMAADKLGLPYTICSRSIAVDQAQEAALRQQTDVARALELHAIGWRVEAVRAWEFARAAVSEADRLPLIQLASDNGWYDRVVLALSKGDDLRHYELRFPIAERKTVERESAINGLDPVWTLALIRAESAWQTDARSPANAWGLMQLLPTTGKRMARELGVDWRGTSTLVDPVTNIRLGTRYLAQQAARFDGSPWLATAAYNAGPTPVARWLSERGALPPDIFIETIPYRETREYVMRVLAFSAIYDWRLDGKTRKMSNRMLLPGQRSSNRAVARTQRVVCPTS